MTQPRKVSRLGNVVRARREELGLSLNALARRAGIDPPTVLRIEKDRLPSPDKLSVLAEALDLPLADLYEAAGYPLPTQLPSIRPYLRHAYRVPEEAVQEIEDYLNRIAAQYGGPAVPRAHEDEDPDYQ